MVYLCPIIVLALAQFSNILLLGGGVTVIVIMIVNTGGLCKQVTPHTQHKFCQAHRKAFDVTWHCERFVRFTVITIRFPPTCMA